MERSFAWLSWVRRLSKNYGRLTERGELIIYGVMNRITLRMLPKGAV
jgi:transposase